ncbi:hypothetical protein [Solibacillus isronensis]|uniref:hypothetical protein n=1 Tax=Solibacillus isronensis TaxID=412383 RepID=UPI0009A76168|nr:hypothetical protein [Solibacillus isronensis]
MILKRGVTGFSAGDLSLERDWVALTAEFKKYCYASVQQLNGCILAFFEPDIDLGYAHAHVKIDGEELYIFHNNMYDDIAFTSNRDIGGLKFTDHKLLGALFENHYTVLTASQLAEPLVYQTQSGGITLMNENELNDVELRFMNHFRSQTVGDLVFNYWD